MLARENTDKGHDLSAEDKKILELIKSAAKIYDPLLSLSKTAEDRHFDDLRQQCQRDWDFPLTIVLNQ